MGALREVVCATALKKLISPDLAAGNQDPVVWQVDDKMTSCLTAITMLFIKIGQSSQTSGLTARSLAASCTQNTFATVGWIDNDLAPLCFLELKRRGFVYCLCVGLHSHPPHRSQTPLCSQGRLEVERTASTLSPPSLHSQTRLMDAGQSWHNKPLNHISTFIGRYKTFILFESGNEYI